MPSAIDHQPTMPKIGDAHHDGAMPDNAAAAHHEAGNALRAEAYAPSVNGIPCTKAELNSIVENRCVQVSNPESTPTDKETLLEYMYGGAAVVGGAIVIAAIML